MRQDIWNLKRVATVKQQTLNYIKTDGDDMLFKWDENTHMYHQEDGTLLVF